MGWRQGLAPPLGAEAASLIEEETLYFYMGYFLIVGAVFNRD
jgi:hypothetical protein